MKKIEYIITNPLGMHARIVSGLKGCLQDSKSEIFFSKDGYRENVNCYFGMMNLQIKRGDHILIEIEGPDEEKTFHIIQDFLIREL